MNAWIDIVFPVLNVLILVLLLWALSRKPLRIFLAARAEGFKNRRRAARARLLRAEAYLQESEARSLLSDQQQHELMRRMLEYGRRESEHLLSVGQEKLDIMRLDARRQAALELARLQHELYRDAVVASVARAKREVKKQLDARSSSELVERSMNIIADGIECTSEQEARS